uniref:Transcriptional regulator, LysR family n=1 Tax=Caulobacter sp. (strain K31) TaxID=366602 RepID=B0T6M8_CAUSK
MSQEPSWDLYRTFAAVLQTGSFSAAGRRLGLTQPTVARQIEALEMALGAELFVRTHRGMSATAAAARLRPYADTLLQTTAALVRSAAPPSAVGGTVRITAGHTVGTEALPPILAGLRRAHPQLHLELSLSDTLEDLLGRKADVAVRMVEPTQKALVARRVNTVEIGLYAHRDYLTLRGTPVDTPALEGFDLIGFDTETPTTRAAAVVHAWLDRSRFVVRTDSEAGQFAAIRSGLGIGYCQTRLAAGAPELVRVLESDFALYFGMWVAMHESLRSDPACRAVFDALAIGLADPR